jgi:hypothetical protein
MAYKWVDASEWRGYQNIIHETRTTGLLLPPELLLPLLFLFLLTLLFP